MALSGVRSSWLMLARNWDLCLLASSSSRPLSSISRNRRAFWMARADWVAKVLSSSTISAENSPGVFRMRIRLPMISSSRRSGTESTARNPARRVMSRTLLWYAEGWVMSATWTGSRISAARPDTPSPFRMGAPRRASAYAASRLSLARPRHDRIEHRLHVERRSDRAADFAKRRQLLDGLGQLGGARLQFPE